MNKIQKIDDSVSGYQNMMEAEFTSKWEEIAKAKSLNNSKQQDQLFESEDDQGKLI